MWLIEGPFDGRVLGGNDRNKSKLLKCGTSYMLGRKRKESTCPYLFVNHPKISSEHALLVVGKHSTADVADTNIIPTLTLIGKFKKPIYVDRAGDRNPVNANEQYELRSGDKISSVSIEWTVTWKSVCCYFPSSTPSFSFEKCASLGIKLFAEQKPEVTHCLTPTLDISPGILCSLLRLAQVVHPDWLKEYLRLGDEEKHDHAALEEGPPITVLEFEFLPPSEPKHRPAFSPNLPSSLSSFKSWEPNEERDKMLKGWRVLFVGEKGREADQDLLQMLEAGGAEYEVFDVSGGEKKWKQVLEKNIRKASKGLSVVADEENMRVAAETEWAEISGIMRDSNLRAIKRSKLLEAVLYVDTSRIDSSQSVANNVEESISNSIPVTIAEESSSTPKTLPSENVTDETPAQAGPSRRPLRRRATASRAGSATPASQTVSEAPKLPEPQPTPSEQQVVADAPPPRRPLVRRARTAARTNASLDTAIVGVDDPSVLESQPPVVDPTSSTAMLPPNGVPVGSSALDSSSAPARPSRLKRRRNGDDTEIVNPVLAELQRDLEQISQIPPPLKKFKALFDETDPERLESQGGAILSNIDFDDETGMGPTQTNVQDFSSGSQTQTQTQSESMTSRTGRKPPSRRLAAVAEEVEETQSNVVQSLATIPPSNADIEMDGTSEEPPPNQAAKPVSVSNKNSLQTFTSTQQPGKTASGAEPGKPDTDAVFLKAIASTKKGKKGEDDFDREFNNLRISKPEIQRDAEAKQWELLADFGDDGDLRGNFMVIIEMDLPEKPRRSASVSSANRPEWQGKTDHKAFKKKHVNRFKNPVELVAVNDENDYGMGAAYWKTGSQSQSQSQSQGDGLSLLQQSQMQNRAAGSSSKPPSKAKGKATQPRRGRSRSVLEVGSGSEEDEAPKRARKGTQSQRGAGKSQPLFLPDDDDEDPTPTLDDEPSGEVFDLDIGDMSVEEDDDPPPTKSKGRGGKATQDASGGSKRKRTAALLDDDAAFKGFGTRKKTRI